MLAILGLSFDDELQRLNATKNVLAALANLLAGVIFAFAAHVDWAIVALIVPARSSAAPSAPATAAASRRRRCAR